MQSKHILILFAVLTAGFTAGFLVANSINRTELSDLKGENERLKTEAAAGKTSGGNADALSRQEIDARIAQADNNPGDFQFQKNLGLALYRYAAMKQDVELIGRSTKLLERAAALNGSDKDVRTALGNAYFDAGYFAKDNANLTRAREIYEAALKDDPNDVEIRTDVGLTYFLQEPPDLDRAVENFRASLAIDPKHEKTLQFIIQAFLKQGRADEARRSLDLLKLTNPESRSIEELSKMVEEAEKKQQ